MWRWERSQSTAEPTFQRTVCCHPWRFSPPDGWAKCRLCALGRPQGHWWYRAVCKARTRTVRRADACDGLWEGRGRAPHNNGLAGPVHAWWQRAAIRRAFKCRPSPKARVPHACADRRGDRQPRAFRLDRSKARRYPRSVRHDRRGSRKVRVVCDKTTRKPFRRGDAVRSAQRLTASLEVARRRGR